MDYPKSTPNVGLVGGKFVDENTGTGQPGSLIPAAWGNAVTDELLAVIKAAGLVPSESDLGQLQKAIQNIAASDVKRTVRVATTGPIALSGAQAIDGVAVMVGDRVLVKDQAAGAQNWIYTVTAGAWVRALDANESAECTPGHLVIVESGTANAGSIWQLANTTLPTLGTTALVFAKVFGKTGVAAGSYRQVTVDVQGRVMAGANPTTLAGYGITDAYTQAQVDASQALKAPLASPALTGVPTTPTPAAGTNSKQVANTEFVQAAITALIAGAPGALDTLKELATALNNDPNFATTIVNALATKANIATTLAGYGITDAIKQGDLGLCATAAPLLGNFKTVNPTGTYYGYGLDATFPTPGAPPGSKNNLLAVFALSPRPDRTYYLAFENGGSSIQRQFWLGQYAVQGDSLFWSSITTSDQEATQQEAQTGTTEGKWCSPLRVFQALRSAAAKATESLLGVLRVGTLAEVNAGTLDDVAVTPRKLRYGSAYLIAANGYVVFPDWFGGLTIQWGTAQVNSNGTNGGTARATLPRAFANSCFGAVGTRVGAALINGNYSVYTSPVSQSQLDLVVDAVTGSEPAGNQGVFYIAVGN
ncbi:hypothetical protein [Pseudomonas sp. xss_2]|uniref:gp53-like domain-containing protein n=1 Tax=Pseudomonas sp. xss_2 TaxID=3367215 RepID=UPI00370B5D3D